MYIQHNQCPCRGFQERRALLLIWSQVTTQRFTLQIHHGDLAIKRTPMKTWVQSNKTQMQASTPDLRNKKEEKRQEKYDQKHEDAQLLQWSISFETNLQRRTFRAHPVGRCLLFVPGNTFRWTTTLFLPSEVSLPSHRIEIIPFPQFPLSRTSETLGQVAHDIYAILPRISPCQQALTAIVRHSSLKVT